MNKKTRYILIAAGAVLGWLWYRNRTQKAALPRVNTRGGNVFVAPTSIQPQTENWGRWNNSTP